MSTLPQDFNVQFSIHSDYSAHAHKWELIRDSLAGEVAIKKKNEKYLPMPSAMLKAEALAPSTQSALSASHPDYHSNQPYSAYKSRARFPELTDATLRGIIGLILRNPSAYHNLPADYLQKACTKDGKPLTELELQLDTEVMSMGRAGLLVDPDPADNKPKIVTYATEDILNWRTKGTGEDIKVVSVLLRDTSNSVDFWETDDGAEKTLLLIINDDGYYEIGEYTNGKFIKSTVPTVLGKPITFIPFILVGTMDLTADIDSAPLWPLANVAKAIYQVIADLRNAQFMSCNPMLTISGIDKENAPAAIGSSVALLLESHLAKAYYPKTDTTALEHVRMYIRDLQTEAIRMGANLLGNESTQAESGEAIRLKQAMASATVASVVATCGKGLQRALNMIGIWLGRESNAEIKVNTEFSSFQLTANEQIALVQSWQAGLLSTDTALENFRKAGMLQEGEDSEAEIERLEADTYRKKIQAESEAKTLDKGPRGANKDGSLNLPEGSESNPAVAKAGS